MKNMFQNAVSAHVMVWETDPRKRNTNNELKFMVKKVEDVKTGDVLVANFLDGQQSCFEITEIKNRRAAALSTYDYLTVTTKWSAKIPPPSSFNLLTNASFNKFFNI